MEILSKEFWGWGWRSRFDPHFLPPPPTTLDYLPPPEIHPRLKTLRTYKSSDFFLQSIRLHLHNSLKRALFRIDSNTQCRLTQHEYLPEQLLWNNDFCKVTNLTCNSLKCLSMFPRHWGCKIHHICKNTILREVFSWRKCVRGCPFKMTKTNSRGIMLEIVWCRGVRWWLESLAMCCSALWQLAGLPAGHQWKRTSQNHAFFRIPAMNLKMIAYHRHHKSLQCTIYLRPS